MRPWVGELFPSSKTQMQVGNMATGSFGWALGSRSLCPFVLLFSGENGVTDRTVGWNQVLGTDPISTVEESEIEMLTQDQGFSTFFLSPCLSQLIRTHAPLPSAKGVIFL